MVHGSATACYDIVVYACLKAISPTKNQASTRLEVKTAKVRVSLLKDYLLTLEIGSYVCTNRRGLAGNVKADTPVADVLDGVAKGTMVRAVDIVDTFLKALLAHAYGEHYVADSR